MHPHAHAPTPPRPAPASAGARGFTLIELMTAVVVLGVLLAVAGPGLAAFVRSSRVNAAQSEMVSALMLARSEAAKRGQDVQVVAASGSNLTDFSAGWLVATDRNADGSIDRSAGSPDIIRTYPAPPAGILIRVQTVSASLRFAATGFLSPLANATIYVCDNSNLNKSYKLFLQPVGLVDIQSPVQCVASP